MLVDSNNPDANIEEDSSITEENERNAQIDLKKRLFMIIKRSKDLITTAYSSADGVD